MIGEIIDILQADLGVTTFVSADNMFPIQRKQGSGLPCIVVDLLDIRTSETKHLSSDLDFARKASSTPTAAAGSANV